MEQNIVRVLLPGLRAELNDGCHATVIRVRGMAFIEAVVKSSKKNSAWTKLNV